MFVGPPGDIDGYNCAERSQEHNNILITLVYNGSGAAVVMDLVISNGRNMMHGFIVPQNVQRQLCTLFWWQREKYFHAIHVIKTQLDCFQEAVKRDAAGFSSTNSVRVKANVQRLQQDCLASSLPETTSSCSNVVALSKTSPTTWKRTTVWQIPEAATRSHWQFSNRR